MTRKTVILGAALLGLLTHGTVQAQQFGPPGFSQTGPPRPTLSPFLNIIGGPAVNYYNGTNFQFDQYRMNLNMLLQPNVALTQPTPSTDDLVPTLPQTGHAVGFQYYNPYFGNAPSATRSYFPYNPNQTGSAGAASMTTAARPPTR